MKKKKNKNEDLNMKPTLGDMWELPSTSAPPVVIEQSLHIISAGLMNGVWGIMLSNGMRLDGVEEINQTKPSYSDGYTMTAKIFIPTSNKPITKSNIPT